MAMPVEPCCLTWRILVGIALAHDLQGASVYVLSAGQGAHCGKKIRLALLVITTCWHCQTTCNESMGLDWSDLICTYAIRMCFFGIALLFGPCLSGWMLRLEFEVLTMNSWTFARLHLEAATHAFSINLSHLVLSYFSFTVPRWVDPQKRDKCWLTSSSLLKQILNSWPSWNFLVLGKPGGGPPHLASHVRKQRLLRLRQVHVSHLLPLVCRRHSLWTESFWVSSTRQSC